MHKILYLFRYLKYYLKEKNNYNISFFKCLKAFFHGFTPDEYYFLDFDNNDINDYLSEFKRRYYRKRFNGNYSILLDNKMLFKLITKNNIPLSPIICFKSNNTLLDENNDPININDLLNKLSGNYFLKPLTEGGGKGIIKLSFLNNKYYINENEIKLEDIKKEIQNKESFIIEKEVEQAKYSKDIYPKSANTIRIVTLKMDDGSIKIVKAVHRFGTDKSEPTDNFSRYGIACNIDIDTGTLNGFKQKNNNILSSNHPDTNSLIKGITIPRWQEIKESIIKNHYTLSFFNFIAWDILITEDNYVVIEANNSCGTDISQIEEGIKHNKEFYSFLKKKGVLK